MNRERAKELLPIIQAFAEGKTVQMMKGDDDWFDVGDRCEWFNALHYRIKPEPREFWIFTNPDESLTAWPAYPGVKGPKDAIKAIQDINDE